MSALSIVVLASVPLILGALVALLAALIYTAVTFAIWIVDRREAGELAQRPTTAERVRLGRIVLDELWAAAWLFFLHPFGSIDPAPPYRRELGGRRPILFVPGCPHVRSNFWLLSARLWARDLGPLYAINLKPWDESVLEHAGRLSAHIDEIMRATGAPQIDVVAHSMGGIAVRIAEGGRLTPRIRRLVTIGTPHGGTRVAELVTGQSGVDLRIRSSVLAALPPPPPGMIVAISSAHDNVVVPPENGQIGPRGRDVIVEGVGHLAMLLDENVGEEVAKALGEDVRTRADLRAPLPRYHAVVGAAERRRDAGDESCFLSTR